MKFWQKFVVVLATFALLLNSLVAPLSVLAEETPSPEPTTTPIVEATATPTEMPTTEPTPTVSSQPIDQSTIQPVETPTPEESNQPIETQSPESSPTIQDPPETPEKNTKLNAVILENEKIDESILNNFDLDYMENGSASITTDKLDYAPTDTAVITGTGFVADKKYTINITSSDEPAVDFKDTLTANEKGEILYSYTLDGKYRPNYQVKVKDLDEVVAETTFTDSWPSPKGSISGYKWNDLNKNSSRDLGGWHWVCNPWWNCHWEEYPAEPKLSGWTIDLKNPVGTIITSQITDVNGNYSFNNLTPGNYQVCEVLQGGWTNVTPLCQTIIIPTQTGWWGQQYDFPNINFGNHSQPDTTPPIITKVISGTPGTNGWYTSDVTVTWTVTDPESTPSITGCGVQTFTDETTGETSSCSATSTGGPSSDSVLIKIDKTAPSANLAITSGNLGLNSWYTSNVTVSTSGTDSISTPVVCTTNQYQTTDTVGQTFNGQCTNDAGLSTSASPLVVKVDKTSPEIPTINGFLNPNLSCSAITNSRYATVDWSDSDDITSGIAKYDYYVDYPLPTGSGRGVWNTSFTVSQYRGSLNEGIHYIKVRARDLADNVSEWSNVCSITYDITSPSAPKLLGDTTIYMKPGNVTRSWERSASEDVVKYIYKSFSSETAANSPDTSSGWSPDPTIAVPGQLQYSRIDPTGDYERTFWWRVAAVDAAGNKTWSDDIHKVVVDKTPPTGSWVTPTDDSIVSGIVTLNFSESDALSGVASKVYSYSTDGINFTALSGNLWDTTDLPLGDYILRAAITDKAGNTSNFDETVGVSAIVSSQFAVSTSFTEAVVTWTTDKPTTSRVVYDTVGHDLGTEPNYGYTFSTTEDSSKVTSHSVTLTGLNPGQTYYYRVISHGSPVVVGSEGTFNVLSVPGAPAPSGNTGGGVLGISTVSTPKPKLTYVKSDEETSEDSGSESDVLGANTESTPAPESTFSPDNQTEKIGVIDWILSHKLISLGILLLLIIIIYLLSKKKKGSSYS